MCGIFALLINDGDIVSDDAVRKASDMLKPRGPEFSVLTKHANSHYLGFHRLAINGLDAGSNQPIVMSEGDGGYIKLICNGEIYNYRELYETMGVKPTTHSDCEVIIHLYKRYGMSQAIKMLDGVFAFVLLDGRISQDQPKVFIGRDPFGVRPLFMAQIPARTGVNGVQYIVASEKKAIVEYYRQLDYVIPKQRLTHEYSALICGHHGRMTSHFVYSGEIVPVEPSHYYKSCLFGELDEATGEMRNTPTWTKKKYFQLPMAVAGLFVPNDDCEFNEFVKCVNDCRTDKTDGCTPRTDSVIAQYFEKDFIPTELMFELKNQMSNVFDALYSAVEKRVKNTDRPIACLLSGGLDSSIITSLVKMHTETELETYSIGFADSVDLKYARRVADYLQTKHTEIIVTPQDFIDAIPEVIRAIESFDTTTVRASIGNYLVAKYIREHSEAKVIFNGDGSDEVCGGYLYFHKAPDAYAFDKECRRLLRDIHMFDVLRSDRSISCNGLEARTPFLDKTFVSTYFNIIPQIRAHSTMGLPEKYLLRMVAHCYIPLPYDVVWRTKEAFSDGISGHGEPWYKQLDRVWREDDETRVIKYTTKDYNNIVSLLTSMPYDKCVCTAEQKYYIDTFLRMGYSMPAHYDLVRTLPYYWMPKFIEATDASARTLEIYEKHQ